MRTSHCSCLSQLTELKVTTVKHPLASLLDHVKAFLAVSSSIIHAHEHLQISQHAVVLQAFVNYSPTLVVCVQSIAISGCSGARDDIWDILQWSCPPSDAIKGWNNEGISMHGAGGQHVPEPMHNLQTLSCVGCKELTVCRLGMREVHCGDAMVASSSHSSAWVPCPTKVTGGTSFLMAIVQRITCPCGA